MGVARFGVRLGLRVSHPAESATVAAAITDMAGGRADAAARKTGRRWPREKGLHANAFVATAAAAPSPPSLPPE